MAGLNATAHNAMLDGATSVWPPDALSLHSSDPGAGATPTASTELSGNGPTGPYSRPSVAWSAAAGRSKSVTAPPTFQVPGSSTVAFLGYWRGSTYLGCRPLANTETYNGPGTYTPTSVTESLA